MYIRLHTSERGAVYLYVYQMLKLSLNRMSLFTYTHVITGPYLAKAESVFLPNKSYVQKTIFQLALPKVMSIQVYFCNILEELPMLLIH